MRRPVGLGRRRRRPSSNGSPGSASPRQLAPVTAAGRCEPPATLIPPSLPLLLANLLSPLRRPPCRRLRNAHHHRAYTTIRNLFFFPSDSRTWIDRRVASQPALCLRWSGAPLWRPFQWRLSRVRILLPFGHTPPFHESAVYYKRLSSPMISDERSPCAWSILFAVCRHGALQHVEKG